jgi:hypothetical protein
MHFRRSENTQMNGTPTRQPGLGSRRGEPQRRSALHATTLRPRVPQRLAGSRLGFAHWLTLVLAVACQASVQADARVSGDEDEEGSGEPLKSFDRPIEAGSSAPHAVEDDFVAGEYALLGARHDLSYAGPKSASCACLAVALRDQAKDNAFTWELGEPRLEPSSQWIIALSSNEVPCDSPPSGTLGASYQGYVTEGNDVVVYVEALGEGRPMTNGAIIPRPKPTGSVFVEPTNGVYGKPLEGKSKRCKLSPPGGTTP